MYKIRFYNKSQKYNELFKQLKRSHNQISAYRLITAALILISLMLTIFSLKFLFSIPFLIGIFAVLLKKFQVIQSYLDKIEYRKYFFKDYCESKLNKDWRNKKYDLDLQTSNTVFSDLAFIGEGSFLHKIQLQISYLAKQKLKKIVEDKKIDLNAIQERQTLVKELSAKISNRIKLFFEINKINKSDINQIEFINWLNTEHKNSNYTFFKILSIVFFINIMISAYYNVAYPIIIQFFIQLICVNIFAKKSWLPVYFDALKKEDNFLAYKHIIELLTKHYSSSLLKVDENNFLFKNKHDLLKASIQFQKLSEKLSVVYSGMGHVILNAIMFWDCWYIPPLLKWKKEQKEVFPKFLDILSTIEYLEIFAHYHYLFPNTSFTNFIPKGLKITNLGHPLLNRDEIVTNNFSLSDKRMFIITGSNMAGKTTFLRSIGLNLILSYVGCPVYADKFETQKFSIYSSINISDNINDGISLFYAEVKRLREIVEGAESNEDVIFFIDEMLKGTNSKERTEASIKVIERLLKTSSIGFFSTHDLNLSKLNEKHHQIQNYHFSESDDKDKLNFDFKLKEGAVNSTNALDILKRERLF